MFCNFCNFCFLFFCFFCFSGGIFEAMITTVGGLIVGIIAYVFYNYLVSKVEKVIQKMEGSSIEFLDILDAPGK